MQSSTRRRISSWAALAVLATGFAACGSEESQRASPSATSGKAPAVVEEPVREPGPGALIARGKQVYNSNCIACHNVNPAQVGALGPELAGASLQLVEAKVLHNEYPAGYTPKRATKAMIPLPHLERDIPAIVAYLDSVK